MSINYVKFCRKLIELIVFINDFLVVNTVSPSANPIWRNWFRIYPTNVYDGNKLLLPILWQKMALSGVWCLLTCWMVVGIEILRTYNTIPVLGQKNTLNKQIIKHWIIKHWIIKQNKSKKSRTETNENWTTDEQYRNWQRIRINTDSLNIQTEGWIVTVQYLQELNIFAMTELTIATLFARVLVMRHQMSCCQFLSFSSGLTHSLLKNHRNPQQLCCLIPITPVQYQLSSITAMIVSSE